MTRKTQVTCDGCGEAKTIAIDKRVPDGWKEVTLSWTGLRGYPSNLDDGLSEYDLCSCCARHLVDQMFPSRWPRAKKDEAKE